MMKKLFLILFLFMNPSYADKIISPYFPIDGAVPTHCVLVLPDSRIIMTKIDRKGRFVRCRWTVPGTVYRDEPNKLLRLSAYTTNTQTNEVSNRAGSAHKLTPKGLPHSPYFRLLKE